MPTFWTMSWLVGVGVATIPIIIHILNRRRYRRVRWAAMEFLLMAEKVTRKRLRIEHLLLLAVRTLVMLLIAWALARPIMGHDVVPAFISGDSGRNVIVILDDSYSMGHKNAENVSPFDRAGVKLNELFGGLPPGTKLTLIRSSDAYRWSQQKESKGAGEALVEPFLYISHERVDSNTKDGLQNKIDQLMKKPSDTHSDFMTVFRLLNADAERMEEARFHREVVIISDFRRFGWLRRETPGRLNRRGTAEDNRVFDELLDKITGNDAKNRAQVSMVDVGDDSVNNVTIEKVAVDAANVPVTRAPIRMSVELLNRGPKKEENVEVACLVNGKAAQTIKADVLEPVSQKEDAAKKDIVTFTLQFDSPGPYSLEFVVRDSLEADSHYFYPLNLREGIRVLLINGEGDWRKPDGEVWVLRYALFPQTTGAEEMFKREDPFQRPQAVNDLASVGQGEIGTFEDYDIVIVANVAIGGGDLNKVKAMEKYVRDGGSLIFFLGKNVQPADFNQLFFAGGQGLSPAMIGEPDGDATSEIPQWELMLSTAPLHRMFEMPGKGRFIKAVNNETYTPTVKKRFPLTIPRASTPGAEVTTLFSYRKRADGSADLPAVVMKEYDGGGVTALFSFTADGEWADFLANDDKMYVSLPFMHWLIQHMMVRHAEIDPRNVFVGQPLVMRFDPRTYRNNPQIKVPEDKEEAQFSVASEYARFVEVGGDEMHVFEYPDTYAAGRYLVRDKDNGRPPEVFGVNVFLAESNLERVSEQDLRAGLPRFVFTMTRDVKEIAAPQNEWWKWLMYAVLGLLVVESVLAAAFSRSQVEELSGTGKEEK